MGPDMNLSRVLATSTTEASGTRFQSRMVAADLVTFPKAGFALTNNFWYFTGKYQHMPETKSVISQL